MKTFRIALEEMASFEALHAAWQTYRSGKRRRPSVARFELEVESHLLGLSRDLLSGRYRHGPYRLLPITDPKPRLIAVASVRDRVLHTALYRALGPSFNATFIDATYACLEGRGSHLAILRFLDLMRRNAHLCHLDIRSYFPSIDHSILRMLLHRRLRDGRVRALINEILRSGGVLYQRPALRSFYCLDEGTEAPKGLPIGNLTSQWWGNLYLDGLDHFVTRELRPCGYLRYMDDFVLFDQNKETLRKHRTAIRVWLKDNRRLQTHPEKGHIRPTRLPHTWLGHRITQRGHDLGPKAIRRFHKQLGKLVHSPDTERIQRIWAAWRGAITF